MALLPKLPHALDLERAYPWCKKMCIALRAPTRILMIADGGLDFGTGAFGLSELVTEMLVPGTSISGGYTITTAHRSGATADITNFRFDQAPPAPHQPFNRQNYDQLWLFGIVGQGAPLPDSELRVIEDFMQAGGGVFATGDHADLGAGMCGNIPRVRSMRKWYTAPLPPQQPPGQDPAPSGSSAERLDTLSEGHDPHFQFNDQSDDVAQRIYPQYYHDPGSPDSYPHPLLVGPSGDITVLPDHAHEGECVVPSDLTQRFGPQNHEEYPEVAGQRVAPVIVAHSMSGGGYNETTGKPPVNVRCFGAIGAYDGRLANVGRVVVDATWHHFLNINLKGTGSGDPNKVGFYDAGGNPTADWHDIRAYFQNIEEWLTGPRYRRICWPICLRYTFPLLEELRPIPKPGPDDFLAIGQQVRVAVAQAGSRNKALVFFEELLQDLPDRTRVQAQALTVPWSPFFQPEEVTLVNRDAVVDIVNGAVMVAIANALPEAPWEAVVAIERMGPEKLEELIDKAAQNGLVAAGKALYRGSKRFRSAMEELN